MARQIKMGMNRTGIAASPSDGKVTIEGADKTPLVMTEGKTSFDLLTELSKHSEPVGHVPPPTTVTGIATAGINKLMGKQSEIFLDRLGERLAFERTGTRLYDAMLAKCQAEAPSAQSFSIDLLRRFRDQELEHFFLVKHCMEQLGGDPTAMTPCADVAAVESMGLMQTINDPRVTADQSLHALLIGELSDNAGWQLLINLAKQLGQNQMAQKFEEALIHEEEHLAHVRRWHDQAVAAEMGGDQAASGHSANNP